VKITILDVNDNAPIFSQHVYHASIAENAALNPPAAVLQVSETLEPELVLNTKR
jgi:hypothetical protein